MVQYARVERYLSIPVDKSVICQRIEPRAWGADIAGTRRDILMTSWRGKCRNAGGQGAENNGEYV
jgi:hypothetical protein